MNALIHVVRGIMKTWYFCMFFLLLIFPSWFVTGFLAGVLMYENHIQHNTFFEKYFTTFASIISTVAAYVVALMISFVIKYVGVIVVSVMNSFRQYFSGMESIKHVESKSRQVVS